MTQDELKTQVGRAALAFVAPGGIIGVGTGSTVNKFIDALGTMRTPLAGAVSSSQQSTERLRGLGIRVFDANEVESLPVYVDGADEIDGRGNAALGGRAVLRAGVITDNGHPILDVHGLSITDPLGLETEINQWPGVVAVGLFARHRARVCLLGTPEGVQRIDFA